jgi:hypothetical protein
MNTENLLCANCKTFVPRNNIRIVKGFPVCLCCVEYNHINYDALDEGLIVFSHKMKELIRQKEQESMGEIKIYY